MTTNRPGHPWVPRNVADGNDDVLQRAVTALSGNRPNEAEQIARDILNADRRNARASYVLGSALVMQGRPLDAIAPLEDAARGRHDAQSDTMLAIALRQAGRVEDAYLRLKRTTKRRLSYAAAFLELGRVLASMERDAEAAEALMRGVEVTPMMPEMSIQLGYVLLRRRRLISFCAGAYHRARRAVRHRASASGKRRKPGGGRLFSPLPHRQSRRPRRLGQTRALLARARSARCWPRLLPHRCAPRSKRIWQCAIVVGEVQSRSVLAQAKRRRAISAWD
jgi:tetratricopeptide (TPR) repeat protein